MGARLDAAEAAQQQAKDRLTGAAEGTTPSPGSSYGYYGYYGGGASGGQAAQTGPGIQAVDSSYAQAMQRLAGLEGQTPSYTSQYDAAIDDAWARLMGRGSFSYDLNADALYRQYADRYRAQGQAAMRDTMGQAAALTGGYGSSYGQQAGQQAYDAYLQQLNAVVPELYDRAYGAWQDEGSRLAQTYSALLNREAADYSRAQDDYNRWVQERAWAQDQADREYQRQGENLTRLQSLMSLGYSPTDQEVADAGLTPEQYAVLLQAIQGGGMDSNTGSTSPADWGWYQRNAYYGYENGKGLSQAEIKQIQKDLGMENPDGIWGPKTEAAYKKATGN